MPAAGKPLKVAFAYVGPVGDAGWTFAHDKARKAVEAEFGDKVQTTFVESVPEGADAERVIRDMVGQGNKLIFGRCGRAGAGQPGRGGDAVRLPSGAGPPSRTSRRRGTVSAEPPSESTIQSSPADSYTTRAPSVLACRT